MKRRQSSRLASRNERRMDRYVPLIREFAARDGLFHEAVARTIGLHSTDEKVLRLLGPDAMTAGDRRKVVIRTVSAKLRDINRLYGGLRDALQTLLSKYDATEFEAIMDFLANATETMAEQTEK